MGEDIIGSEVAADHVSPATPTSGPSKAKDARQARRTAPGKRRPAFQGR